MKYLLDTHAFIWFLEGNTLLPQKVLTLLRNPQTSLCVSVVSFWEIAIKVSLGKLILAAPLETYFEQADFLKIDILPISALAILHLTNLPYFHKDPFDRLLIATALTEKEMILISADSFFKAYPDLALLW